MRRVLLWLVLSILVLSCAAAEPIGFGFVNNTDVALRRGIGGKTLVRLPQDTCVWVKESATDDQGTLWYHINAGLNVDNANVDYDGWMKAEFIDAGDAVWHDIISVSASRKGMIALRSDGTAEAAGRPIVGIQNPLHSVSPREWTAMYHNVIQVLADEYSGYALLTEDGTVYSSVENLSKGGVQLVGLAERCMAITADGQVISPFSYIPLSWIYPEDGLNINVLATITKIAGSDCRVLLLSEDGQVYTLYTGNDPDDAPEPDWSGWNHLKDISSGWLRLHPGSHDSMGYVGIREDGTVIAAPQALSDQIGNWTDMEQIEFTGYWLMGLKIDGTVISLPLVSQPPDVSSWTDIVEIGMGSDYCVGRKKDGTLVFAGEHIFMGEGHTRR